MKKKILLTVFIFIVSTSIISCGKQNKTVKENAQVVADAFTDGDMEVINETIFGTEEFEVNDELSSVWEETGVSQNIIWVVEQDLWHMINKKWYGLNDTLSSNK